MSKYSPDDMSFGFTYHPQIDPESMRIVRSLSTDFVTRQRRHVDNRRQKELDSFALNIDQESKAVKHKPKKVHTDITSTNHSKLKVNAISTQIPFKRSMTQLSPNLQKMLEGQYAENSELVFKKHQLQTLPDLKHVNVKDKKTIVDNDNKNNKENEDAMVLSSKRSQTMPSILSSKSIHKISNPLTYDRLIQARKLGEIAIKLKKIFTIQGGYSTVRRSLRQRGWVEKFFRITASKKNNSVPKKPKCDDDTTADYDDDDDDDDGTDSDNDAPKIKPWDEDNGLYGIMSRLVRDIQPSFFWVLQRDMIDSRSLTKDQILNYYGKSSAFTTKVGLCLNMRNVPWYENVDPNTFFPRCYRLSHDEEKEEFIDDYHLTACTSMLVIIVKKMSLNNISNNESEVVSESTEHELPESKEEEEKKLAKEEEKEHHKKKTAKNNTQAESSNVRNIKCSTAIPCKLNSSTFSSENTDNAAPRKYQKRRNQSIPPKIVEIALNHCENYISVKNHEDLDVKKEEEDQAEIQWNDFLYWYYRLAHNGATIRNLPTSLLRRAHSVLKSMKKTCPQFVLNGVKNVWIVKPGAKSRGRGIMCMDRLEDILKLVSGQVVRKDGKYVIQKYIERPLLIYNTKFDIRQWFLVTDWNPLTLWFYQDSYLRFCSQQFTLSCFDESIHLSNNAIQKHYKNGPRARELPSNNMWNHIQFQQYLNFRNLPNLWEKVIYPGMKKAIICCLLACQESVESRKGSFELYGADFMLTEDFRLWLIEINSSPSMEASTPVTAQLCSNVLEDTIKVVIDRKMNKNCSIGRFELAYKMPTVPAPPYIGIHLGVEGHGIEKLVQNNRQQDPLENGLQKKNLDQSISLLEKSYIAEKNRTLGKRQTSEYMKKVLFSASEMQDKGTSSTTARKYQAEKATKQRGRDKGSVSCSLSKCKQTTTEIMKLVHPMHASCKRNRAEPKGKGDSARKPLNAKQCVIGSTGTLSSLAILASSFPTNTLKLCSSHPRLTMGQETNKKKVNMSITNLSPKELKKSGNTRRALVPSIDAGYSGYSIAKRKLNGLKNVSNNSKCVKLNTVCSVNLKESDPLPHDKHPEVLNKRQVHSTTSCHLSFMKKRGAQHPVFRKSNGFLIKCFPPSDEIIMANVRCQEIEKAKFEYIPKTYSVPLNPQKLKDSNNLETVSHSVSASLSR